MPVFEPGNVAALRHGVYSERRIIPRAVVHKRRLLRQLGLRAADLDGLGRGLLTNWARAAAGLATLDEYAQREGWLDGDGNPRGFTRVYGSLLNAERLALRALEEHVRERRRDASAELEAHLEATYAEVEDG